MTKTPSELATLLNISTPSLRRWCSDYAAYLSPAASPPKGKPRVFSEHDERVFLLITHLRDAGLEKDDITARLDAEQQRSWQGLPELPPEFNLLTLPSVPADQAASRAYEMAQVAALQTQVQFLQQQNQDLTLALETARTRVEELEAEIERLRQDKTTIEQGLRDQVDAAKHEQQAKAEHLQDELSKVRAEVARIEGQLSSYSFGRERPLNVGLLLAGAILFGVLLVIVVFVVANLLA